MGTKDLNFWLGEEDLKTPKHDEIVLWTFNNAEKILKELNIEPIWNLKFDSTPPKEPYLRRIDSELTEESKICLKIYLNYLKEFQEKKKIWETNPSSLWKQKFVKTMEYPLKGYNGFNLGFIDLMVIPHLETELDYRAKEGIGINKDGYMGGFNYAFEIKPQVKSIGEVLRQFQFYKSNLPRGSALILVTGTKGLKEVFESQGFFVVEYDGGKNGTGKD